MKRGITPTVTPVVELSRSVRSEMLQLMKRYYDRISAERFHSDLAAKAFAVLLHDRSSQLVGFSTVGIWQDQFDGRAIQIMYSGDTIIDHRYWGSPTFASSWLKLAARIKDAAPQMPLYWFLIVKGHRTYRYLSVFARRYYPAWNSETPPEISGLMTHLGMAKFGHAYDAEKGIVHFSESQGHLLPRWATIPGKDAVRPEVRFFAAKNPGYISGDELVCLAEITADNMRPFARRIFERASRG
jgi:hypothetical protein